MDALGGLQVVGHSLRPERDPALAGQWLSDCLNSGKRDKLSLAQISLIFRRAHALGAHEGWNRACAVHGYAPTTPVTPQDQLADALRQAERLRHESELAHARLVGLMRSAGVFVEGM